MEYFFLFSILPMMAVELALGLELGVIPLAEHLVAADGDGVRKVQGTRFIDHRDADASVGVAHEHMLGDAACFFAENDVRAVGVAHLAVLMARLGGKEEVFAALCLFKKVVDTVIIGDIDKVPVVEPRAFEVAVGDLKAEGSHKMEPCARSGTGARDVAGVLRDLRLKEHNIQYFVVRFFQFEFPLLSWNKRNRIAKNKDVIKNRKELVSCKKQ